MIKAPTLLVLLSAASGAGGQTEAPPADIVKAYEALDAGRYLAARDAFANAAFGPDGKVRDEGAFQSWAQYSPMTTNELPTDALLRNPGARPPEAGWKSQIRHADARDALSEIVRRARSTSIVILNEAHYSPRDRAFALTVARALRPLGYATLAAETFTNPSRLATDGFARINSGAYLKDPVFAGFVREALAMGYRPVAYEMTMAQRGTAGDAHEAAIATRENAQVVNLMSAVFTANPAAKVMIYVGHSHVAEAPLSIDDHGKTIEWMAARLKKATGVDPLTIDQTD